MFMVKVKEDMTGWKMWEHGVPESRLVVIEQTDDYITPSGKHVARWLCECTCEEHNRIKIVGNEIRSGGTKSCGCLAIDKLLERSKKTNKKDLSGEYGILWLNNTEHEVYFDLEDADKILEHCWFESDGGYAATNINGKIIKMHQYLGYKWHDHHDRNKLNNRKQNLVKCTRSENNRNVSKSKNNTSGIIGVHWENRRKHWVVSICENKNRHYLGSFQNKRDAIIARLKAEQKYFGEFAPQRHLFDEYGITS